MKWERVRPGNYRAKVDGVEVTISRVDGYHHSRGYTTRSGVYSYRVNVKREGEEGWSNPRYRRRLAAAKDTGEKLVEQYK